MLQVTENYHHTQPLSFIREGFVTLNPAQMNTILRECEYDRQRNIDANHVAVLAEIMRRGQWEVRDKLDFARLNGRLILVNGYHRAHAQVAAGLNVEWTIVIHDVKSLEDVRALYTRFDTNVRTRGSDAILNGYSFDQYGLLAVTARGLFNAAPIIADGLAAYRQGRGSFARRIMEDRLAVARSFVDEARIYDGFVRELPLKQRSKFLTSGTMAVALVTLAHQEALARLFWEAVLASDGLRKGDPRLALNQFILSAGLKGFTATQQYIYACTVAWNAVWEKRELQYIRIGKTALRLFGTPHIVSL